MTLVVPAATTPEEREQLLTKVLITGGAGLATA
jgi:hypothetical protein